MSYVWLKEIRSCPTRVDYRLPAAENISTLIQHVKSEMDHPSKPRSKNTFIYTYTQIYVYTYIHSDKVNLPMCHVGQLY